MEGCWQGWMAFMIGRCSRVAACIIGDEILAGRTLDTNSHYLAKKCFEYGLRLGHVRVIPDQQKEIVDSIRELSQSYSLVFTSGGIGPTHDDITYGAIAAAFHVPLQLHEPTIKAMHAHYRTTELNEGQLRMATIPKSTAVLQTPGLWVPLVQTENVLILPGVPILFTKMIDHLFSTGLSDLARSLNLKLAPRMRISIKTDWKESTLAAKLKEIQRRADEHQIALGSYPKLLPDGSTYVIICVSGSQEVQTQIQNLAQEIQTEFDGIIQEQQQ